MNNTFQQRRLQTGRWLARESPAEQMLEFYLELLELQEPVYREALSSDWGATAAAGNGGTPWLDLKRLRVSELVPRFRTFLRELAPGSTEVLTEAIARLDAAEDPALARLLESFLRRLDGDEVAAELSLDPAQLDFFPRAFLQPIAEALAEGNARDPGDREEKHCPQCGWPPQVAVLRDEPEAKGQRLLVCSLCGTWWPFRRSTCPACGETDAEKLVYHVNESTPHIRVEECRACHGYVKGIDLRKDGMAVPVVEDIASVELDLWSDEQGLWKIQRNLLGF